MEYYFGYWRNRSTFELYEGLGIVTNNTNNLDGQAMVLYKSKSGKVFVREINEFKEKFMYF